LFVNKQDFAKTIQPVATFPPNIVSIVFLRRLILFMHMGQGRNDIDFSGNLDHVTLGLELW